MKTKKRMSTKRKRIHKIRISQKNGTKGRIMTGATTEIMLDGKPLKGCRSATFSVSAGGVAMVNLEMYADVEIEGNVIGNYGKYVVKLDESADY